MNNIKYNVTKKEYDFDDHGREFLHIETKEHEAIHVYDKPVHYCDKVDVYFAAECSAEEAERVKAEFNKDRPHQFAPYMNVEKVSYGYLFIVIEPYND